jgi:cytochrome c peroxidase
MRSFGLTVAYQNLPLHALSVSATRRFRNETLSVRSVWPQEGPMAVHGTSLTRRRRFKRLSLFLLVAALLGAAVVPFLATAQDNGAQGSVFDADNDSGKARTVSVSFFPVVATQNPFFLELGANGRRCVTCHQPDNNMSVSAAAIQARFDATDGTDPIFRTNDGSNSPLADVSTVEARRSAYSMLLTKGLIRIGLPVPPNAEFELEAVSDPYGYAGDNVNGNELSLFRRPLPTTNLAFLSTVMWDGRETLQKGSLAAMVSNLGTQANTAVQTHAQGSGLLGAGTREQILVYELGLYTAQVFDKQAFALDAAGAQGGPEFLSRTPFVFGGNDPGGCDAMGANCRGSNPLFDPLVFRQYDAWANLAGDAANPARAAMARGQALFNTLPITIDGVFAAKVSGTCTTCHDTPHAGGHSVPSFLNAGLADPPLSPADGGDGTHNRFGLPVGDMPVYTLRNKATGELSIVTDPGRALITGLWKDIGRLKPPILRGLAGRAPYFHNGSAATLQDVVNFYNTRFDLGLTDQQKADLVAFLRAL